jgi:hypothetical protein
MGGNDADPMATIKHKSRIESHVSTSGSMGRAWQRSVHLHCICRPDESADEKGLISHQALVLFIQFSHCLQIVGTVPPSIMYSVPVMEAARDEARKAMSSATSLGLAGRPIGMPPSESIKAWRALS